MKILRDLLPFLYEQMSKQTKLGERDGDPYAKRRHAEALENFQRALDAIFNAMAEYAKLEGERDRLILQNTEAAMVLGKDSRKVKTPAVIKIPDELLKEDLPEDLPQEVFTQLSKKYKTKVIKKSGNR